MINVDNTMVMIFGDPTEENIKLKVGNDTIANVEGFVYLGSLLTSDNDCTYSPSPSGRK